MTAIVSTAVALDHLRRTAAAATRRRLSPPPTLTVSEWADQRRMLSRESSAEPGQWSTDRAPYQRGIMDAFSDPRVESVVVMSSAQVGKTETLLNVVGFYADQDPAPVLVIQPTIEEAEQWSKTRLAPMIRDTPALREKFREPTSKNSGNTLRVKEYPGGHVTLVGANSPSGLAAKPIRVVLGDEVDRWPVSAGTEGDPMTLVAKRTATFWNRKLGWWSTPSLRGGRIEQAFLEGDQRRYFVPCPGCGLMQTLRFGQLRSEVGPDGNHLPESIRYGCEGCDRLIEEHEKRAMLLAGEWRASAPFVRCASFHLNALYSVWTSWADVQREYNASKGDLARHQVFTNTVLGEPWEDRGGGLDASSLESHIQVYPADVPDGVGLLTCWTDVQGDRIEVSVWGWGEGLAAWRIRHIVIPGDPGRAGGVWDQLEDIRTHRWTTAAGGTMLIFASGVDSAGGYTDNVYAYCKPRIGLRVYATKGSSTPGSPLAPSRPSRNNKWRCPLFLVGTEAAKDRWYSMLRTATPGPGYVTFDGDTTTDYLIGLTSERVVRENIGGRWHRSYQLPRGMRNEPLDCAVGALAVLYISGMQRERLGALAARARLAPGEAQPTQPEAPAIPELPQLGSRPPRGQPRRTSGWVNKWR